MNWKRNKDYHNLTVAQLIDNTIREEIEQAEIELINDVQREDKEWHTDTEQQGFYRGLYLLNEML